MDFRHKAINELREFNRYYTVRMELLTSDYLKTPYSLLEIRVLFEVMTNEKLIQCDIVRKLNADKSYLSRTLKKLEKQKLITRCSCGDDKRSVLVMLTPEGKREAEGLIEKTNSFIGGKIDKLDERQCSELCDALGRVSRLLKSAERSFSVVPFEERYRRYFIEFNTDWITGIFGKVERHDTEEFGNIDKDLENGAMIFFAVENENVLAACMAKPLDGETWEICKLCSNKNYPHKGAGSAVFEACASWALDKGAERLFIISNSRLKPALHIYKKFGFKEIKLDDYGYERGDVAFEYIKTK